MTLQPDWCSEGSVRPSSLGIRGQKMLHLFFLLWLMTQILNSLWCDRFDLCFYHDQSVFINEKQKCAIQLRLSLTHSSLLRKIPAAHNVAPHQSAFPVPSPIQSPQAVCPSLVREGLLSGLKQQMWYMRGSLWWWSVSLLLQTSPLLVTFKD